MKKRTFGVCCLMATSGLAMSAQQAQAGHYELTDPISLKAPESRGGLVPFVYVPTPAGDVRDSWDDGLYAWCSADGTATASASGTATDFKASASATADSMTGNAVGNLGNFSAVNSYAQVFRAYEWNWEPDAHDIAAPFHDDATPFQLTLPATSFEHDVEAQGSNEGGAIGFGSESVSFSPIFGGGYASDSDGSSFDMLASDVGETPKSQRPATPRGMKASSQGERWVLAYAKASCVLGIAAIGSGSRMEVKKQEAQFGEMTLN